MRRDKRIYSVAYMMPPGGKGVLCTRKHRMHLERLARILRGELPQRIAAAAMLLPLRCSPKWKINSRLNPLLS